MGEADSRSRTRDQQFSDADQVDRRQPACAARFPARRRRAISVDFDSGLEVIENRAESLNRFLQAYRQLMGLPAPKLSAVSLAALVQRVAQLERRVPSRWFSADDVLEVDADQLSRL